MQLFNLVNTIMANDKSTSNKNLNIITYSVFPLSPNTGIIGWVPNCDTLNQLIKEHRAMSNIVLSIEHRKIYKLYPKFESSVMINKIENVYETTLGDFVFAGCNLLESVSIPNSVDLIGVGAFSLCSNLEKIILPTNLKTIEEETFLECVKLSDVSLPEGLETIKEMAFMWCSSLSFITLPSSLKYIEGGAFRGCVNLSSINLPNKLEFIVLLFDIRSNTVLAFQLTKPSSSI
jgi:hypothetical protein